MIMQNKNFFNNIKSITNCTGFGACFNICPVNAIYMQYNEEGFYSPSVDESICINCGKCAKICPSIKFDNEYVFPLQNLQFEDLSLPAPIDPLQHLYESGEYGEYGAVMTFPTISDSGFFHTQMNYSSDVDYDNILHELTNIYEEIKNENKVCTTIN